MFDDQVTCLIPTSPIPCHPSTTMVEQVLQGIRAYFPDARIIIMGDGVRPQIENRRGQYMDYLNALGKVIGTYGRVELCRFPDYSHQLIMTREMLNREVRTPYMLFIEHDAVLHGINDWPAIFHLLDSRLVNLVRFYHWDRIWHEHEYLMRGEFTFENTQFVRTVQYSGWPHIVNCDFYRQALSEFHPATYKMLETALYNSFSVAPWEATKMALYYPEYANTFIHLNGRVGNDGIRDPGEW